MRVGRGARGELLRGLLVWNGKREGRGGVTVGRRVENHEACVDVHTLCGSGAEGDGMGVPAEERGALVDVDFESLTLV